MSSATRMKTQLLRDRPRSVVGAAGGRVGCGMWLFVLFHARICHSAGLSRYI
jgi:hypothetical protein